MLKACDLHKTYCQRSFLIKHDLVKAVDGVSLSVMPGQTFGLIGETGCGKSTLARLMVGLEHPDAGMVLIDESRLDRAKGRQLRDVRKKIQLVFQDPYLAMDSRITIWQIMKEPLDNFFQFSEQDEQDRVASFLIDVGLDTSVMKAYTHELSGGQRQRVALARSLTLLPKYLVLDEPLASLDVSVQAQILNLLVNLKERFELTYIFISHDLNAVQHLCDTIAVMFFGKIVEVLPRFELSRAVHPYTNMLLESLERREGQREDWLEQALAKGHEEAGQNHDETPGCSFAQYCSYADMYCSANIPALKQIKDGWQVACWKKL